MATYLALGRDVLHGDYPWAEGFYYQPFYYTVLVPVGLWLGGTAGLAMVQVALGTLTVLLTGLTAAHLFGRRAGLVAAAGIGLHRMSILYAPFAMIATVQTFWMAVLSWLGVQAYRLRRWPWWAALGLVNGLAIVTRGNALLFTPLCVALALWRFRSERKRQFAITALILAGVMLPQVPYSWLNHRATGKWVTSTAGGNVLALGNTPEAPPGGREADTGPGPMSYPASYSDWVARAKATGADQRSVGRSIVDWAQREPMAYLELKLRMGLLFLHRSEIPNNVSLRSPDGRWVPSRAIQLPFLVGFGLLGTLGLMGMALTLLRGRHRPAVLFCGALAVTYAASIVLFYILARFRVPVVPLFAMFAGVAVDRTLRVCKRWPRPRRELILLLGCFGVASSTVLGGFDYYRLVVEAPAVALVRPNGVQLDLLDRYECKDHGPMAFGGWIRHKPAAGQWEKQFVVPEAANTGREVAIEFAVASPHPQTIEVNGKKTDVNEGLTWVVLQLPLATDHTYRWTVEAAQNVSLIIDLQRQYARSLHAAEPLPGELVTTLKIPKESAQ